MPSFITRVELHGADDADYKMLHQALQRSGFRRQVLSGDRTSYDLPSSMYHMSKPDLDVRAVRDLVQSAAESIGKRFWVFTAEYVRAAWTLHATDDTE